MKLNKKQKKWLTRIIIAAVLFVVLEILVHMGPRAVSDRGL